ncbi:ABC transporter ATP-binding protein [Planobispora rosea]|uniref:ABC transporter ATP-binding protein n=1 Tax=Planobispora rosea TaxID=35762 RepID=A0A8J3S744_PLARO|nr:ATP-binding cassette domain-containing protein [Planobispora rosea]GGS93132.1 ABC transporter ATP-binding protein [Planobispora rosea]GIH87177.1 ABC transporter ATP-binding protein [Planobispora rosea]
MPGSMSADRTAGTPAGMSAGALLTVEDLRVSFPGKGWRAPRVEVLKGVSLDVRPGETLGLVGESGSGKTTIGRAILGLVPVHSGAITFAGERIDRATGRRRRELSRDIQVVFQDPYTSLNPSLTIGDTLSEPLLGQGYGAREARARVARLLERVELPADAAHRLPREFSGGQRQRVAIARALAIDPRLIVCDEPVSALDLTTQKTVLDLLLEIQEQTGVSYLFVSHDLSVIRFMSHRVAVIRHGEIVELGEAAEVTAGPRHPYTRALLLSAPVADVNGQRERREAFEREFRAREAGTGMGETVS